MSGNCRSCGQCSCECGGLPGAVALTFTGIGDKIRTGRCDLNFESCFGSGAKAVFTGPGGCLESSNPADPRCPAPLQPCNPATDDSDGPLGPFVILEAGSCYAKPGREEPTLTITATPVSGSSDSEPAKFTASLEVEYEVEGCRFFDDPLLPRWRISKITATGGKGYAGLETVRITTAWDDATIEEGRWLVDAVDGVPTGASLSLEGVTLGGKQWESEWFRPTLTIKSEPSLDEEGARAATFRPVFKAELGSDVSLWSLAGIEVTGGRGYAGGEKVEIVAPTFSGTVTLSEAAATVIAVEGKPTGVEITAPGSYYYPRVEFMNRLTVGEEAPGIYFKQPPWSVERFRPTLKIEAPASGSGSTSDATFSPIFSAEPCKAGDCHESQSAAVWRLVGVSVSGGSGYKGGEPLVITAGKGDVVLTAAAGSVIAADGKPTGVTLSTEGEYYRNNPMPPAIVSPVTATTSCSTGAWKGVVDSDPGSPSFGSVIDIERVEEGDDSPAWYHALSCLQYLNGQTVILTNDSPYSLIRFEAESCTGRGACIEVPVLSATRFEPSLRIYGYGDCLGCFNPVSGLGCKADISYGTSVGYEDDDPTLPYWSISSISASGGSKHITTGFDAFWNPYTSGIVSVIDPVTNIADYGPCDIVIEESPELRLQVETADGSLVSGTVVSGGKFYGSRPYGGEPRPIHKVQFAVVPDAAFPTFQTGGGYAVRGRSEPTIPLSLVSAVAAPDPRLTAVLERREDACEIPYWVIVDVIVESESEYGSPGELTLYATGDDYARAEEAEMYLRVVADGAPSVRIRNGGRFWRVDETLPPYVPEITIRELQLPPSNGSGAKIDVVVDTDYASKTFGQLKSVSLIDGGKGYILAGGLSCGYQYTGSWIGGTSSGANLTTTRVSLARAGSEVNMGGGLGQALLRGPGLAGNCFGRSLTTSPVVGLSAGSKGVIEWPNSQSICTAPNTSPRPNDNALCVEVTWNSPFGRMFTKTSQDASRLICGMVFGFYDEEEDGFAEASLSFGIPRMYGETVVYWPTASQGDCFCCIAAGCKHVPCGSGYWWEGTHEVLLEFDAFSGDCTPCSFPGSFTVTVTTPGDMYPPC